MLKNNKWKLIVSSLIILLPIVYGLVCWNDLPDHMTTHWGIDGTADGWAGKGIAVFMLPVLMLAIHWLCIWLTVRDHGNHGQNAKILGLMFWIIPVISLFANGVIYTASFGNEPAPMTFIPLLLGLAITVISLARLVNNLYEKHYALVSRLILGFVIASSLKIVPVEFESAGTLALSLVCFGVGFALARYMDCAREKQNR